MSTTLIASIFTLDSPPDTATNRVPDKQPRVGVCLSGGGSRALSCAMGQLRGLRYLGLLDKVYAISSVSGGTWANALFTYLPASITDDEFLGDAVLDPSQLSVASLELLSKNSLGNVPTRLDPLKILDTLYTLTAVYHYPISDLWQGLIGELVLKSYGLWSPDAQGFDRHYVTTTSDHLQSALKRNPSLQASDFYAITRARPIPIFNTSLFDNGSATADLIPFEINEQCGVRATFPAGPQQRLSIGGGRLETLAMGSQYLAEEAATGLVQTTVPERPFSLGDIAGVSSVAFAEIFEEKFPDLEGLVPRYPYWPIQARATQPAQPFEFADGGNLENLGVNAMLARGLKRLIVFVNTDQGICHEPVRDEIVVDSDIAALFGFQPFSIWHGWVPYAPDGSGQGESAPQRRHNQVFEQEAFADLRQQLLAAHRSGGAAMVRQTLAVIENEWFDVPAQPSVDVLWVYNDLASSWWDRLPLETRLKLDEESLDDFPHYGTVTQLPLTALMVNALAHLTCWCIASDSTSGNPGGKTNAQVVRGMFDPEG